MKFLARLAVIAWVGLAALAAAGDGLTTVKIGDETYTQISDVHLSSGGRVTIMHGLGGRTVKADQLPAGFLASWGITQPDIERSTAKAAAGSSTTWIASQNAMLLSDAADRGLVRESDGIVWDLRQPPPEWERFDRVKVLTNTPQGAIVDRAPDAASPDFVL